MAWNQKVGKPRATSQESTVLRCAELGGGRPAEDRGSCLAGSLQALLVPAVSAPQSPPKRHASISAHTL